jgi:hypothetical protein
MRYILALLMLAAATYKVSAQIDAPRGGMSIPKAKSNVKQSKNPSLSNSGPFSVKPEKKPLNPNYQIGGPKEEKSPMIIEDKFVNKGNEFADRVAIKEKRESSEPYKGNQYFGEFKSKAVFVQVMCRDFEYADGDRIKVLVNDEIIVPEITLTNDFKGVQITLKPGFNKIDFEALNQGTSGPNTAEFVVHDDKQQLVSSNKWNLATGFKATVIIVKE